jgi:hypothetical protein
MHTLPFFRQNINNESKMEDPTPRTIFNSNLISALKGNRSTLTLNQTQREKGRVMLTRNQEMVVRSQRHIPIPVSGSSPERK